MLTLFDLTVTEAEQKKKESKAYPREEVLKHTLEYFNGDELAASVWINKYALKDSKGNIYERSQ